MGSAPMVSERKHLLSRMIDFGFRRREVPLQKKVGFEHKVSLQKVWIKPLRARARPKNESNLETCKN